MFLDLDKKDKTKIAVTDDSGLSVTYGDICDFSEKFRSFLPKRTLIFILSENTIGSLLGYTSCLSNKIVPLVLSSKTESGLFNHLFELYKPEYLWIPNEKLTEFGLEVIFTAWEYSLVKTDFTSPKMYKDLSLLLPTSGSTGSPKLVRHSYRNIEANAFNVLRLFKLTENENAMAILPMHYTMGLSVIASHLLAGASIVLSARSLLDKKFWESMALVTSFTGVPYSFEILMKLRFTRLNLPKLKIITQGGGKLTPEMFKALAKYAADNNKKFIATYGQSECTARMAYLPHEKAMSKICSIGIAEPGGQLSIIDNDGKETFEGEALGEMVYRGENVTLGYANCPEDLLKGDENFGVMHTGDLAYRDSDGYYFIKGRLKRFLKIYGLRISLDEIENMVKSEFNVDCVCAGNDEKLVVKVTDSSCMDKVDAFIEEKTHLFKKSIEIIYIESVKRNETGKVILNNN